MVPTGETLPWTRLKTVARLAQDVRKNLLLCSPRPSPRGPPANANADDDRDSVLVLKIDDAFQRPPETLGSRKRALVPEGAAAHSKKKRPKSTPRAKATQGPPILSPRSGRAQLGETPKRPQRLTSPPVSYAEPSLKAKMRRPSL